MENNLKTSWKSRVYGSFAAEEWVFGFRRSHTRATDTLLRICRKDTDDLINLAQFSQVGWEYFKTAVKKIEVIQKAHYYAIDERINQNFKDLFRIAIQTLSNNIIKWTKDNQFTYEAESNYLTDWYKKVI